MVLVKEQSFICRLFELRNCPIITIMSTCTSSYFYYSVKSDGTPNDKSFLKLFPHKVCRKMNVYVRLPIEQEQLDLLFKSMGGNRK